MSARRHGLAFRALPRELTLMPRFRIFMSLGSAAAGALSGAGTSGRRSQIFHVSAAGRGRYGATPTPAVAVAFPYPPLAPGMAIRPRRQTSADARPPASEKARPPQRAAVAAWRARASLRRFLEPLTERDAARSRHPMIGGIPASRRSAPPSIAGTARSSSGPSARPVSATRIG
jgi:hypothetical protein